MLPSSAKPIRYMSDLCFGYLVIVSPSVGLDHSLRLCDLISKRRYVSVCFTFHRLLVPICVYTLISKLILELLYSTCHSKQQTITS